MAVESIEIYIYQKESSHAVTIPSEEKEGEEVDGKKMQKDNRLEMLIPGSYTGEITGEDSVVGHIGGSPEKYEEHARAFMEKHSELPPEEDLKIPPKDNDRKPLNKF